MSADLNNHIARRSYTAHTGDNILSQVASVICVVTPHALLSAGIHPSGEILVVHSSSYKQEAWSPVFIEHELLNDPLLVAPEQIKAVFVATPKNIIIPKELYPGDAIAPDWLKSIYHCEPQEKLQVQELSPGNSSCCFAYPENIEQCFSKYIQQTRILPLNYVHFYNGIDAANSLQCTITDHYALGTLQHNGLLHWHQTFEYASAEDIVFHLAKACQSFGIDHVSYPLSCTTAGDQLAPVLQRVGEFFPSMHKDHTGIATALFPQWSATVHLFQQLNSCV
jgi:hypothetical protein